MGSETALSVIPVGLIWWLKHYSINKVFKKSLRSKYLGYRISKNDIKVSKSAIVEWNDLLWDFYCAITN